jgi:FkbM family methyltransferase
MHLAGAVRERVDFFRRQADRFGFAGALKLRFIDKYNRLSARVKFLTPFWPTIRMRLPGYQFSLYMRTGASDRKVFHQIFIEREYASLNPESVEYIIDCGANVGYSSVYFLNKYPKARVVAVEPDPANVIMCRKNLAPYGDRAQVLQGAVWSHPATLALSRGTYRDGEAWATQVLSVDPAHVDSIECVPALDLPSLISSLGCDRVDILKMDIERSEIEVFGNPDRWLPQINNIAIELHDAECEGVFFSALRSYRYDATHVGELTICRDVRLMVGKLQLENGRN